MDVKPRYARDKRLTQRLFDYWNRLRKDAVLPQIAQFNPSSLEDVIGKCCVWRVEIGGINKKVPVYTSEFIGEEVKNEIGMGETGNTISPRFKDFAALRILQRIDEVVERATIISDEGQFVSDTNKIIKYRCCLLPFGTKKGKVTNILLGLSWKAF